MFAPGGNKILKSRYHPAQCILNLFFWPCLHGESQIRFTIRFSLRTEVGSVVHHVLKSTYPPGKSTGNQVSRNPNQVLNNRFGFTGGKVESILFLLVWVVCREGDQYYSFSSFMVHLNRRSKLCVSLFGTRSFLWLFVNLGCEYFVVCVKSPVL